MEITQRAKKLHARLQKLEKDWEINLAIEIEMLNVVAETRRPLQEKIDEHNRSAKLAWAEYNALKKKVDDKYVWAKL